MTDKTLFDSLVKRDQADDSLAMIAVNAINVDDIIQPSPSMIESIRDFGVLQPILVRLLAGKYQVIDGRRRVLACRHLEIENIPAIIRSNAEEMDGYALSIVTQVERSDNTLSEGKAIRKMVKEGATKAQIMTHLHMTSERYEKMLALSALPDNVLSAVESGTIAPSTAEQVAKLPEIYRKDALEKFEKEGKLTGKDVAKVKEVRKEKAVQSIGEVIVPIPRTPVQIATEMLQFDGDEETDYDQGYKQGWSDALNALIARLE